ncbi:hypothetical protein ACNOYE_30370 [Nannocystaceae bacterium ST9]
MRAWSVYADWLLARGDPWGERLSLELARAQVGADEQGELAARAAALEAEQREYLLGPLVEPGRAGLRVEPSWQWGLLAGLHVSGPRDDPRALDRFAAILASPAARLLDAIHVAVDDHDDPDVGPLLARLARCGPLPALRELSVRDTDVLELSSSFVGIGDLSPVLRACPNLRTLHVRGAAIRFGKLLRHPTLERLCLEGDALARSTFATIVAAELPALRCLELWLGTRWIGSATTRELLEQLGRNRALARLERLGLRNSEVSDDIAAALPDWPLLAHLREVDLSMGTLGDRGGHAILARIDRFMHLRRLDLDHNYLSDELAAALERALGERVRIGRRIDADADDHYPEVGE